MSEFYKQAKEIFKFDILKKRKKRDHKKQKHMNESNHQMTTTKLNIPQEYPEDKDFLNTFIVKRRRERFSTVFAEHYDPEEDFTNKLDLVEFHIKTGTERERLQKAASGIFIYRTLEKKQQEQVLDAMFRRDVKAKEIILKQGDDGDNFYIIESGAFEIYVNNNLVGSYDNQGFFGELALMYNKPRAATIVATTEGKLWALGRHTFKSIVSKYAFYKRKMYEGLLENMPIFKSINSYERMNIADALVSREFKHGETIIKQGEKGTCMYFVESGMVRCEMELDGKVKEIKICYKGDYFGELALLYKKPRACTVYAIGNGTKCAILDSEAFERLMRPCVKIMQESVPEYEDKLNKLFGENVNLGEN